MTPLRSPAPPPHPFLFGTTKAAARLRRYRHWIYRGWALDLNDAVRLNSQQDRLRRQAERERFAYEWANRSASKAARRHSHHRRIILSRTKTCTFCASLATDIVRVVPLHDGGRDVLRNKIPVCDTCRELWPHMNKDLPQRVRHQIGADLPHRRP
ncbi:hypothetical protein [Streptomyces pseudogriseolus]|uniref:hypothetical protein n=1 Tax=Streptomyces pseudogriseolus TaxID=36817 RepID=UPI003FA33461